MIGTSDVRDNNAIHKKASELRVLSNVDFTLVVLGLVMAMSAQQVFIAIENLISFDSKWMNVLYHLSWLVVVYSIFRLLVRFADYEERQYTPTPRGRSTRVSVVKHSGIGAISSRKR